MLVTGSVKEVRNTVKLWKREKLSVGLVPTMGALHDGHFHLIEKARKLTDRVIVSVFVNPTQFAPDEDYEAYPRQLDKDIRMCRKKGATALFTPDAAEIYPGQQYFSMQIDQLNSHMCGATRPGFFEGVALIVNKLLNITDPDIALFGQKDIQQFRILQHMVSEFNHGTELHMAEIVRANDGLALSSRNSYLTNDERLLAPSLYRSLRYLEQKVIEGVEGPALLIEHQKRELEEKGVKIDYLGFYSYDKLEPVGQLARGSKYILAGAVYIGKTRLIDNLIVEL